MVLRVNSVSDISRGDPGSDALGLKTNFSEQYFRSASGHIASSVIR